MRGRVLGAAAALLLAVVVVIGAPVAPVEAQADPGELRHLGTEQLSERLQELRFTTPAVIGETRVRVLLPEGYDPDGTTRYPVLYLLHGGGSSYADWVDLGDAEATSAPHPLIVVMPDGSGYGTYADWYNHGRFGPPMWETYHLGQLVPWIDDHYRTTGHRDGRAVAGLSMGGGGAMQYAARRPQLFTAAAAFSGAVDTNTIPVQLLTTTGGIEDGHLPGSVFGLRATEEVRWRGHNAWDLAENLQGMFLELHTGNGSPGGPGGDLGDPVETGVHEQMTNFHQRLDELGIGHLWNDYGAGGHSWFYWQRALQELLPRLMERFAAPAPPPSPFSHRSIESAYEVYGWRVAIDRPAVEFSRLGDAGPTGFSLTGSGTAEVLTAPHLEPGQVVLVDIDDAAGQATERLVADAEGRLRVPVSLGPGNPQQQHTVQGQLWALSAGAPSGTWPAVTATVTFTTAVEDDPAPTSGAGDADQVAGSASAPAPSPRLPATGHRTLAGYTVAALAGAWVARRLAVGGA